jgi:hypothetical protein
VELRAEGRSRVVVLGFVDASLLCGVCEDAVDVA